MWKSLSFYLQWYGNRRTSGTFTFYAFLMIRKPAKGRDHKGGSFVTTCPRITQRPQEPKTHSPVVKVQPTPLRPLPKVVRTACLFLSFLLLLLLLVAVAGFRGHLPSNAFTASHGTAPPFLLSPLLSSLKAKASDCPGDSGSGDLTPVVQVNRPYLHPAVTSTDMQSVKLNLKC